MTRRYLPEPVSGVKYIVPLSKTVSVKDTIYYREVLRTGAQRWHVYVAESIPRNGVIPALLAGYASRDR